MRGRVELAVGPHHSAELVRQLLDNHAESLEFLKHAGKILTGKPTDRLQIWRAGRREVSLTLRFIPHTGHQQHSLAVSHQGAGSLTFGLVTRVFSPDGRTGAVHWVVQGHDVSQHCCGQRRARQNVCFWFSRTLTRGSHCI